MQHEQKAAPLGRGQLLTRQTLLKTASIQSNCLSWREFGPWFALRGLSPPDSDYTPIIRASPPAGTHQNSVLAPLRKTYFWWGNKRSGFTYPPNIFTFLKSPRKCFFFLLSLKMQNKEQCSTTRVEARIGTGN
ncbi:Hypothetical predicted protein [Podarcis lilfordi]|uniref:Uncharacterized protein n=1 Tax=Podarcis lilfordi TaxID=74358 RepID=A0AA35PBZ9_9SAUR|nr:Hypothetical predicted protein [Podarcis lilfordi]